MLGKRHPVRPPIRMLDELIEMDTYEKNNETDGRKSVGVENRIPRTCRTVEH